MTAPPDDSAVISRSLTDPAHFAIIFDRHVGAVYRFLERRLGRDVADSLAGEVFRIAFERRATYQLERPNCLPWLYGIAKNLLLKERRQQARHLRVLGRLLTEDEPMSAGMEAIDARLDAEVIWPRLAQALADLPVGERDVILLVVWEELSYQEVAEVLDVPIGTVRSRLHRARRRIRELMGPCGQEPDDNPQRAEGVPTVTDDFDLELLRRLRPPTDGPDRALVQRERNALMAVIQQAPEPAPSPPPRRRRARWTVPGVVLALGVTTAAGWAVVSREADNTASFACVADEGRVTSVLPNDGTSPIEACATAWASGAIVPGVTQAPPLAACVSSTGVVTVIEVTGERSCEAADMAPWEDLADFEAVGQAVRSVRVAFHDRHAATGDGCAEESQWRDLLEAELRDQGTSDWAIEVDQIEPDRHCYDVSEIVPSTRTIVLIGTPGEHSIGCDPRTGC